MSACAAADLARPAQALLLSLCNSKRRQRALQAPRHAGGRSHGAPGVLWAFCLNFLTLVLWLVDVPEVC